LNSSSVQAIARLPDTSRIVASSSQKVAYLPEEVESHAMKPLLELAQTPQRFKEVRMLNRKLRANLLSVDLQQMQSRCMYARVIHAL
jgi:hypothetical protein